MAYQYQPPIWNIAFLQMFLTDTAKDCVLYSCIKIFKWFPELKLPEVLELIRSTGGQVGIISWLMENIIARQEESLSNLFKQWSQLCFLHSLCP